MIYLYSIIFLQSFGSDVMCKLVPDSFFDFFFHLVSDAAAHCPENCAVQAKLKDVKNMNWCKFIADFLHDAFSSKCARRVVDCI